VIHGLRGGPPVRRSEPGRVRRSYPVR